MSFQPLQPYALVTLADTKAYIGVVDDLRDGNLTQLINEISRSVLRETRREFAPGPVDPDDEVDRMCMYRGGRYIDLGSYDARSVSAIVIDPDADSPTTLDAADWQLEPIVNPDGVYGCIMLSRHVRVDVTVFGALPVTVTGKWGWPAVPTDVQGWVFEMVEDRFRTDNAFYSAADGSIAPASGPATIPFRIRDEMAGYARPYIGAA